MSRLFALIEKADDPSVDGTWIISASNADRVGDTIDPKALAKNTGKTIPALFGHSHLDIVGKWQNLRMRGEQLLADLKLAAIDEGQKIKALLDAGVPISASIGFRGKGEHNKETGGIHFKELDIFECSIVAVPCHQDAVRIKSLELGIDPDFIQPAEPERLLTKAQKVALHRASAAVAATAKHLPKSD
jgi:HK97 family phage prohead protease